MKRRTKQLIGAAAAVAVAAAGGVGIAAASSGDDDVPITGRAYDQATRAALDHLGGGRVTDTEAGDEDGAYEGEVTLDDGSQIDVHLDESFNVIGTEDDGTEDDGTEDDDTDD